MDGARGSMAKPGTKNTGSHFVKRAAPGANALKIPSPIPGKMVSERSSVANKMMHPPSWGGMAILLALKALRTTVSMRKKATAPLTALSCTDISPPRNVTARTGSFSGREEARFTLARLCGPHVDFERVGTAVAARANSKRLIERLNMIFLRRQWNDKQQ
jgi:hypothetical protein